MLIFVIQLSRLRFLLRISAKPLQMPWPKHDAFGTRARPTERSDQPSYWYSKTANCSRDNALQLIHLFITLPTIQWIDLSMKDEFRSNLNYQLHREVRLAVNSLLGLFPPRARSTLSSLVARVGLLFQNYTTLTHALIIKAFKVI